METERMVTLYEGRVPSPLGTILMISDGRALYAVDFEDCASRMHHYLEKRFAEIDWRYGSDPGKFAESMRAYLDGDIESLDRLAVTTAGTQFQERVWAALRRVPPGTTTSYSAMARSLGQPTASRAVGLANGRNPIAIVIPCHRIIGANGGLTGYAGGLARKRWLLRHEGAIAAEPSLMATGIEQLELRLNGQAATSPPVRQPN